MQHIVTGILAHVDAGKTTLSEALLYSSGTLRKMGRVDHGDAFLDTNAMERQRGITIFAEPAVIQTDDVTLTLLDTPGHVDFSAETERTLRVLDYAILVISGSDGIQGHTETLWRLLKRYNVPTFIFVNKMDAPGADKAALLAQLRRRLGDGCVDFEGGIAPEEQEDVAMQSESAMEEFLESGSISVDTIRNMIAVRAIFPCYFGSALKMEGIDAFMAGFGRYARTPQYGDDFGARVYKVSHDSQGNRLTWMKITGGTFKAKTMLSGVMRGSAGAGEGAGGDANGGATGGVSGAAVGSGNVGGVDTVSIWQEKADQVRVYSGAKFATVDAVPAGTICAVTGLTHTFPGEGLGCEQNAENPVLQPVLTYTLLPGDNDIHKCLMALRQLEDEDPLLHVVWQPRLQEVHVQLMGAVQLEIIQQMMLDRFGLDVSFGQGGILYKETITAPVEGVGHFEPLRHYAEVHVRLEPLPQGSGMQFATVCSEDVLDRNWQRLIMTHFAEREHLGVLTGSPLTDVKITLLTGRAHVKHTEGGDFRQATYRAIRQGLMELQAGVPTDADPFDIAQRFAGDAVDEDECAAAGDDFSDSTKRKMPSSAASSSDDETQAAPRASRIAGVGNCRLLEPWYRFRLDVPQDMLGRAMSDVQRMGGAFDAPSSDGEYAVLTGCAPVAGMRDYAMDVNAYTHGRGHVSCVFDGYRPCHDEAAIVAEAQYDPESDLENTPDSVFCAHGAGYPVKWYKVPEFAHLDYAE